MAQNKWLVRHGFVAVDPTTDVAAVRLPRYLPRAVSPSAVAELLAICPDTRAQVIVLLMVQQTLRCVEVATLQIADIDFARCEMRVVGKDGHERTLPLLDELWTMLERYLDERSLTSGPLIRSYRRPQDGLRADTISGMVADLMSAAGIEHRARDGISAHALRHSAATDMLRQGAHVRDSKPPSATPRSRRRSATCLPSSTTCGRRWEAGGTGSANPVVNRQPPLVLPPFPCAGKGPRQPLQLGQLVWLG